MHFNVTMKEDCGVLNCIISIILCFMTVYCESKPTKTQISTNRPRPLSRPTTESPKTQISTNRLPPLSRPTTESTKTQISTKRLPGPATESINTKISTNRPPRLPEPSTVSTKTPISTNKPPRLPGSTTESDDDTNKSHSTNRLPPLHGPTTVSFSGPTTRKPEEISNAFNPEIGGIIGGVVGGLVLLIIVVTTVLFVLRRITLCKNKSKKNHLDQSDIHSYDACPKSQETTVNDETIYDTLESYQDTHHYQTCESDLRMQQKGYLTIYNPLSNE